MTSSITKIKEDCLAGAQVILRASLSVPWMALLVIVVLAGVSSFNFLLFHTLVEGTSILITAMMLVTAWHTYRYSRNTFLMFLACGYFWIGMVDLGHILAYKGMSVFPITSANPGIQLGLVGRYWEAVLLLTAPTFLARDIRRGLALTVSGAVLAALCALIVIGRFPVAYIDGFGLAPFKVWSEYIIVGILLLALWRFNRRASDFDRSVFVKMVTAIMLTIAGDVAFTAYVGVYDIVNVTGHLLKLLSYWVIFDAVVRVSLEEPYVRLEQRVAERAAQLEAEIERRKASEATIRESEIHAKFLLDSVSIGIGVEDLEGHTIRANPGVAKMLGYTLHEIKGMRFTDYTHPVYAKIDAAMFREMAEGKRESYNLEKKYVRKDGRIVWGRVSRAAIRDGSGAIRCCVGMVEDITDRKEAEEALKESRAQIKSILDASPLGIFLKDKDRRYTIVNQAFCEIQGASAGEVIGRSGDDFLRPDLGERAAREDALLLDRGGLYNAEWSVPAAGGHRHFSSLKFPVLGEGRRIVGLGGIVTETTDKKIAEQNLRESEARCKALVDNSPDGMILSQDGRVLYANSAISALLGSDPTSMTGRPLTEFVHPDSLAVMTARAARFAEGADVVPAEEIQLLTAEGMPVPVEIICSRIFLGGAAAFQSVFRDISRRLASELEVRQLQSDLARTGRVLTPRRNGRELRPRTQSATGGHIPLCGRMQDTGGGSGGCRCSGSCPAPDREGGVPRRGNHPGNPPVRRPPRARGGRFRPGDGRAGRPYADDGQGR